MTITDGTTDYELESENINYVTLSGNALAFKLTDNTTKTVTIADRDTMTVAIDVFVKEMYRKLATIGSSDSKIFWVNCANLTTHPRSTADLILSFTTGTGVTINCINATEATNHYDYLHFIYNCNHLTEYLAGKTLRYVSQSYTTAGNKYATIQLALSASSSGDAIIVNDETFNYTTERLPLKNGVDYVFINTVINISALNYYTALYGYTGSNEPLFHDVNQVVSCNIFGTLTVNLLGSLNYHWAVIDLFRNTSVVNFEFSSFLSTNTNAAIHYSYTHLYGGKLRLKGNTSSNARIYDSDAVPTQSNPVLIDIDMNSAVNSFSDDNILTFPFDVDTANYYRNGYYNGIINLSGNDNCTYSFINTQLEDGINVGVDVSINVWRAIVSTGVSTTSSVNLNNYNQSYSKVALTMGGITETGTTFIIDADLALYTGVGFVQTERGNTTGLTTSYEIAGINYFRHKNLETNFYGSNNGGLIVSNSYYTNSSQARQVLMGYVTPFHRTLATIPDIYGYIYFINMDNVREMTYTGANINVSYKDNSDLRIVCTNSAQANRHWNYFEYQRQSRFIQNNLHLYNKVYVNADETEDYTTVQDAIDGSNYGDLIIVRAGNYNEDFTCETGIDLLFEKGARVYNTGNVITGTGGGLTRIMGYGVFQSTTSGQIVTPTSTGVLYVEFDLLLANQARLIFNNGGSAYLKGTKIISGSQVFDSDGMDVYDADVLHILSGSELMFYTTILRDNITILRNAFCSMRGSSGSPMIDMPVANESNTFELVNVALNNLSTSNSACMSFTDTGNDPHVIRTWNLYMRSGATNNIVSDYSQTIMEYSDTYSNKALDSDIISGGSGETKVQTNLILRV